MQIDDIKPISNVANLAPLGFLEIKNVESFLSIAHFFGTTKKRCGIYCLSFATGHFYIGQAIDVVRRFSEHRQIYLDIVGFSFIESSKALLNDREKELIYRAEAMGLKLKNAIHVSSILGDTDLDAVVSPKEQEDWLAAISGQDFIGGECEPKIILPQNQQDRFSKSFDQYLGHPLEKSATSLLKQYISKCIPFPRSTEYSFWSVSCMPSTNVSTWPRLFCVNVASMEIFIVGWVKKTNNLWAFMTVDAEVLSQYWPEPEVFLEHFPSVQFIERGYRDAGQNQITLACDEDARMDLLLADPGVIHAAASLALRVMRKRSNFYMQYHCTQLSNHLFSRSS
ncbi:hypothetical protein A9236_09455 [Polynucleobacter sp. QLW-P1DATA-2]|uniref:GIY-YIG nuclease family protein n=1 Tax=unclassified Polynucleobacter TaxID=2640945 RepID=UPI0008F8F1FC|nr:MULTISPECIES: GIY-YIG nuclease family protein [unclassified Polynucleobacter]OIM98997.1 hypothetical protein A9236_09455 [Polynucleobacter sp. QLW-P1DATA-2]OIN02203.1 hypothetical protein A9235_00375 [Polynucleobacter sp. MWH-Tro8-2-5-gr]